MQVTIKNKEDKIKKYKKQVENIYKEGYKDALREHHVYKTEAEWIRRENRKVIDNPVMPILDGKEFGGKKGDKYYHYLDTIPCPDIPF